ncbi:MAG: hypothetical protein MJK04_27355 [Psychrosphaera sp.]|nr:hypothetical protein [Psychrosphaera sp.]
MLALCFPQYSYANNPILENCEQKEGFKKSSFLLFNKKAFLSLGTCIGEQLMERSELKKVSLVCSEKMEELDSPLGILGLSKAETIQAGVCAGVINYIIKNYNNKVYQCKKGKEAIKALIIKAGDFTMSRNAVRDLLCEKRGR